MRNRIMILALVLLLGCVLPACTSHEEDDVASVLKTGDELVYQAIQTDSSSKLDEPKVTKISSVKDLENYQNKHKNRYYLDHPDMDPNFVTYVEQFDDDFFADQVLLLVAFSDDIISTEYQVTDITATDGDNAVIHISRDGYAFRNTSSAWHVIIQADKEFSEFKYDAVLA